MLFRGYPGVECDAVLVYYPLEGEHPEALRLALSLSFLGVEWKVEEYVLADNKFNLVTVPANFHPNNKQTIYVQLAIAGIDPFIGDYNLTPISGGNPHKNLYDVACSKFVPFDSLRDDMSPEEFALINKESAVNAFLSRRREKVLRAFYDFADEFPPCVDLVVDETGGCDLEIIYYGDPRSRLRDHLNKVFGPLEWQGSVYKASAAYSVTTTINIPSSKPLAVRVLIINTKPKQDEILTLIGETPRSLLYKSVRFNETTDRQDDPIS
ncbi:MAG: hypothetical protein AMXMBFR16_10690 [Candidatus Uhrbacteria bacterium]